VSTAIVHLIADLRRELIDQRTAGNRTGNGPGMPASAGSTLKTGRVVRQ